MALTAMMSACDEEKPKNILKEPSTLKALVRKITSGGAMIMLAR
jgi:hypothetical protein